MKNVNRHRKYIVILINATEWHEGKPYERINTGHMFFVELKLNQFRKVNKRNAQHTEKIWINRVKSNNRNRSNYQQLSLCRKNRQKTVYGTFNKQTPLWFSTRPDFLYSSIHLVHKLARYRWIWFINDKVAVAKPLLSKFGRGQPFCIEALSDTKAWRFTMPEARICQQYSIL